MRRLLCTLLAVLWLAHPASATVNSSVSKTIALGNGSQTQFAFNFIGVSAAYITVIFTTSSGTETVLTQGPGASQYTISLNAPVQGAIWGMGGLVVYNPSGTPIPAGSTLTIFRTLPLTQAITLQNQASIATLGKGAETGLDTGVMQGQQIDEQIARALQMNITNQVPPAQLPPAAQAAGMGLCFDGTGNNVIACSLAPAGVISSAMAPVVGASTLAGGRTAFGLGSMAVENINSGSCGGPSIQDDGAGNARVAPTLVADATNQTVSCNFHLSQRIATNGITYTLGQASTTYFSGFVFTVKASSGVITITPNAADNFSGVASGASIAIPQGTACQITTNAASTATWYLTCSSSQPSIAASASASALTLSLYAPSIAFRDTTLANGDAFGATPVSGLSITLPSGATLGMSNNTPFRVWIFTAYNSGTPILGVATCSLVTPPSGGASAGGASIYPCAAWETLQISGTGITSGSTAAGTLYTSAGVSNTAVRIIGYADYASGLSTAGTWASAPTTLQVCMPPFVCKRPGDVVQTQNAFSSGSGASTASAGIVPTSKINPVKFFGAVVSTGTITVTFKRGATTLQTQSLGAEGTSATLFDLPAVTTSTTYSVNGSGADLSYPSIVLEEIMG